MDCEASAANICSWHKTTEMEHSCGQFLQRWSKIFGKNWKMNWQEETLNGQKELTICLLKRTFSKYENWSKNLYWKYNITNQSVCNVHNFKVMKMTETANGKMLKAKKTESIIVNQQGSNSLRDWSFKSRTFYILTKQDVCEK